MIRLVLAAALATATLTAQDATALLAKANDAFQKNQAKMVNWNWTVEERAFTRDTAGKTVQEFPVVKAESIVRSDGRRCEAILSWSDGTPPYPEGADNDTRCQLVETDLNLSTMALDKLLQSRMGTISAETATDTTIVILPDKHLPSSDPLAKCAAAIAGTVHLDRATFFPKSIHAEVVAGGCRIKHGHQEWWLDKGTTFELDYTLQHDRAGRAENDFWIVTRKRVETAPEKPGIYVMRARKFAPNAPKMKQGLVSESRTIAQQFGAQSTITFGDEPVKKP